MKAIAAVDIMDGKVVRLLRGNPKESTVYGDDPVAMAKRWAKEGAHMLHIVDLDATLGFGSNLNIIREIALAVDVPVQIAGGLRNAEIIDKKCSCAKLANLHSSYILPTQSFVPYRMKCLAFASASSCPNCRQYLYSIKRSAVAFL